jgi:hypothetical protein
MDLHISATLNTNKWVQMGSKPQNSNFLQNSSNFDYTTVIYVDHIHE